MLVEDLEKIKVPDLETGKKMRAELIERRSKAQRAMREAKNNAEHQEAVDLDYRLKKAVHNVQGQMTYLFKQKRGLNV